MSRTGTFISEKKGILGALVCEPQKPDKALLEYFPRKAPRFTVLMGMQGGNLVLKYPYSLKKYWTSSSKLTTTPKTCLCFQNRASRKSRKYKEVTRK